MSSLRQYYTQLTETTDNGGLLASDGGGAGGGVSSADVAAAVEALEEAQGIVDAAQDAANAASQAVQDAAALMEEADDDAKNDAQDALLEANEANDDAQSDLIAANTVLANANRALVEANAIAQNNRLNTLEDILNVGSDNVLPVADSGIIAVWINTNTNRQRIVAPDYYVTDDPAIAGHKSNIVLEEGTTTTIYIIGRQYIDAGNTPHTGTIGTTYEVTKTNGVLTAVAVAGMWLPDSDYTVTAWDDLTNTQNTGLNTASVNPNLIFSGNGAGAVDLSLLHDGAEQDARLDALENVGTTTDGVTPAQLQEAVIQVEAAQAAVDDAQDAVAEAEELDDDAKNDAQDTLIEANMQLAEANATLAAANQTALLQLPDIQAVNAAIEAQALAQTTVDEAQDALAAAEALDDEAKNAAQDALIQANSDLAAANATLAAANSLLAHDGAAQDQRLDDLENADPPEPYDDTEVIARLDGIDTDQIAQNDALQVEVTARQTAIANIGNPDELVRTVTNQTVNGRKSFGDSIELLGDNVAALFWRLGGLIRSRVLFNREIVEVVTEGQQGEPTKTLTIGGFEAALTVEDKIIQPSTVETDPGNSSASKDYVDTRDVAISAALQAQIDSIVSSLPVGQTVAQALAADMAALASEISDTDADFTQAFADLVANRTDIDANTAQAQINASGLATEIGNRQQADIGLQANIDTEAQSRAQADTALQTDIDTRDAQNVKLTGEQVIQGIKSFVSGIVARAGVRLEDATGVRITLLPAVSVTEEYVVRLPDRPPLAGEVLSFPDENNLTQGQWVYPFGFGFQLFEPDDVINTINDMDSADALVQLVDTTDLVEGLWKIEVESKFGYNTAATDYIAGLYDEAETNKNDGAGYDNSLDYFKKEPKDVAGTDPTGVGAGTDQFEDMSLSAFVRVVAGENKIYSFRHRPGSAGIQATARNIKVTIHRVRD